MNTSRLNQLRALRDRLNTMGDRFYASAPDYVCVRPHQYSEAWNRKRIRVRNKINRRLAVARVQGEG